MNVHITLTQSELTSLRVLVVTSISDYLDIPPATDREVFQYCALRRFYKKVFTRYYLSAKEMTISFTPDEYVAILNAYYALLPSDLPQLQATIERMACQGKKHEKFIPNSIHYEKRQATPS